MLISTLLHLLSQIAEIAIIVNSEQQLVQERRGIV